MSASMVSTGGVSSRHFLLRGAVLFYLAALFMVLALLLGGGARSGYLSDALLQFVSVPVLLLVLGVILYEKWHLWAGISISFCLLLLAVPLVQLIPLPPEVWTRLPGHGVVVSAFELAGLDEGWMPISVLPRATWLGLAALLPPITVFLLTLLLDHRTRRLISLVVIVFGLVEVFVGLLQIMQGAPDARGFFANRNHFAALIYCLIVFVLAWLAAEARLFNTQSEPDSQRVGGLVRLVFGVVVLIVLIGAQLMTRSRSGVGLTIFALFAGYALAFGWGKVGGGRQAGGHVVRNLMLGAILLVIVFSTQFALYRVMERFEGGVAAGSRVHFAQSTIVAAKKFMPWGAGIGTFVPVYALYEKSEHVLVNTYANRAHNDVLEYWLEAGVMGGALMGLFVLLFAVRAFAVWRAPAISGELVDLTLKRAACIIILLLIAHSLVSYPLRTGALEVIFAFVCALLIDPLAVSLDEKMNEGQESLLVSSPGQDGNGGQSTQPWPVESVVPLAPARDLSGSSDPVVAETQKSLTETQWGKDIIWPEQWGKSVDGNEND